MPRGPLDLFFFFFFAYGSLQIPKKSEGTAVPPIPGPFRCQRNLKGPGIGRKGKMFFPSHPWRRFFALRVFFSDPNGSGKTFFRFACFFPLPLRGRGNKIFRNRKDGRPLRFLWNLRGPVIRDCGVLSDSKGI